MRIDVERKVRQGNKERDEEENQEAKKEKGWIGYKMHKGKTVRVEVNVLIYRREGWVRGMIRHGDRQVRYMGDLGSFMR